MRVAIACGGTGGHLFPGLAVGEALRAAGHDVLLLVSEKEVDRVALAGGGGFSVRRLSAVGWPGVISPRLVPFAARMAQSYLQSATAFRENPPSAVLAMGGFTSFGPLLAARRRRIPSLIHESNAVPGRANLLASRWAGRILVGLEDCATRFPGRTCDVTGTPVRAALLAGAERGRALAAFGLAEGPRTLLVVGGSQGALAVNRMVGDALARIDRGRFQSIHLAGPGRDAEVAALYAGAGWRAHVAAFCDRMDLAYSAVDLVIARAGGSTLAELSARGLPSILIPYPHAGAHQERNAEVFERAGAARVVKESGADDDGDRLAREVLEILGRDGALAGMAERSRALGHPDAARRVAEAVVRSAEGG